MLKISAPAKINWYLEITGKRADGYHTLKMLMQKISLSDTIELQENSTGEIHFTLHGGTEDIPLEDNLVVRAAKRLQTYYRIKSGANIVLTKQIPSGAGMGGGSADAAATVNGLCRLWQIFPSGEELQKLLLPLGADIPFCLQDQPALVEGIGEKLSAFSVPHSYELLLAKPRQSLPTAQVFRLFELMKSEKQLPAKRGNIQNAMAALQAEKPSISDFHLFFINELEAPALKMCGEITDLKNDLIRHGARFAQMSGSGSAVFGVFEDAQEADGALDALLQSQPNVLFYRAHTL